MTRAPLRGPRTRQFEPEAPRAGLRSERGLAPSIASGGSAARPARRGQDLRRLSGRGSRLRHVAGQPDQQPRGPKRLLRGSEAARGQVRSRHRPPRRSTRLPLPTRGVSARTVGVPAFRTTLCGPRPEDAWARRRGMVKGTGRSPHRDAATPAAGWLHGSVGRADHQDASGARPFSIAPWSSSPPTMASAFAPVVHAG